MTNPFSGGAFSGPPASAGQPTAQPSGFSAPSAAEAQFAGFGGMNTPQSAAQSSPQPTAPAATGFASFGAVLPETPANDPANAPANADASANAQGEGEANAQGEGEAWRLGMPVVRNETLSPAPAPWVPGRKPVVLADGTETDAIPGEPEYPMPAPLRAFEVERDRYGRYLLPNPRQNGRRSSFTRATTLAHVFKDGDAGALSDWKDRKLIEGLSKAPELLNGLDVSLFGTDQEFKLKKTIKDVAEAARVAGGAADGREFGTALHAWTEAIDTNQATIHDVPEPMRRHVASYITAVRRAGLEVIPEFVERIAYVETPSGSQIVGTIDRIFRVAETGQLVIGDIKTSSNIDYAWTEISIQLGLYANAVYMLSEDGTQWEPMPEVSRQFGVVLSVPHTPKDRGIHALVTPVNLVHGWRLVELGEAVRAAVKESRHAVPLPALDMTYTADEALDAVMQGMEIVPDPSYRVTPEMARTQVDYTPETGMLDIHDHPNPAVREAVAAIDAAGVAQEIVDMWVPQWPDELVSYAQTVIAQRNAKAEAVAKAQATRAGK